VTVVIGSVRTCVLPLGQTADPVHEVTVTTVVSQVGCSGVAALKVQLLVIVTVQVIVSPPTVPTLLH
jgi:hypothetical protein